MGVDLRTRLVLDALNMALGQRRPREVIPTPVWMAPLARANSRWCEVACAHVSGLVARHARPRALMASADRGLVRSLSGVPGSDPDSSRSVAPPTTPSRSFVLCESASTNPALRLAAAAEAILQVGVEQPFAAGRFASMRQANEILRKASAYCARRPVPRATGRGSPSSTRTAAPSGSSRSAGCCRSPRRRTTSTRRGVPILEAAGPRQARRRAARPHPAGLERALPGLWGEEGLAAAAPRGDRGGPLHGGATDAGDEGFQGVTRGSTVRTTIRTRPHPARSIGSTGTSRRRGRPGPRRSDDRRPWWGADHPLCG